MTLKKIIKMLLPYGIVRVCQKVQNSKWQRKPIDVINANELSNKIGDYGLYNVSCIAKDASDSPIKLLNLQINDYCNSRCVMCRVWKQKNNSVFPIDAFALALSDPLFTNVETVMLTGGEPTLVANLVDYYSVALDILKNLKSISITTNCIQAHKALQDILSIKKICDAKGVNLDVALSVDGVGEVHDANRGIKNNFKSFMQLFKNLKSHDVKFFISTTITPINVWDLEKILCFADSHSIDSVFRVAGFVDRLYNHGCTLIRNFSDDEKYQIRIFFNKLYYRSRGIEHRERVYYNIQHMIGGGNRAISCKHQLHEIVTLGHTGDLRHCSPKGSVLGMVPNSQQGLKLYAEAEERLDEIKCNSCSDCIHDTGGDYLPGIKEVLEDEQNWKKFFSIANFFENMSTFYVEKPNEANNNRIFIVGWYGTETVGDKAILAGVVHALSLEFSNANFAVASLYPFVTERTLKELNIKAEVVSVYSRAFFEYSANSRMVCVAGGPLMELEELSLVLWAFHLAKRNNNQTRVFGCGIGPLYTDEKVLAVKKILELADDILVRDIASQRKANEMLGEELTCVIPDPSIAYIKNIVSPKFEKQPYVALFLRELTEEYRAQVEYGDFIKFREQFEYSLAENIRFLCSKSGLTPKFYSMHNFVVGGDDRDFNYRFTQRYLSDLDCYVENSLSTVESIIDAMKSSTVNICMRFHSVVFAHTLDTDFVAIDYTSGGKIGAFMAERMREDQMVAMKELQTSQEKIFNALKMTS